MGKSKSDIGALQEALIEAWEAIPDSIFQECLDSIPKRIKAIIKADG